MNIDQIAMCYISIYLSERALETNGKLFSNFGIIFRIRYNFLNNSGVRFVYTRWGGICAD